MLNFRGVPLVSSPRNTSSSPGYESLSELVRIAQTSREEVRVRVLTFGRSLKESKTGHFDLAKNKRCNVDFV